MSSGGGAFPQVRAPFRGLRVPAEVGLVDAMTVAEWAGREATWIAGEVERRADGVLAAAELAGIVVDREWVVALVWEMVAGEAESAREARPERLSWPPTGPPAEAPDGTS